MTTLPVIKLKEIKKNRYTDYFIRIKRSNCSAGCIVTYKNSQMTIKKDKKPFHTDYIPIKGYNKIVYDCYNWEPDKTLFELPTI